MSKPSLIILVLEDDTHKMLTYRYLINCGFRSHEIRALTSPSGRGSAEQWVRNRFTQEVREYRRRHARAHTGLIVMLDADMFSVQERLNQLDQALEDSGDEPIDKDERVARLIPKRNVETWILCLEQTEVDEETDYTGTRSDWNELIPTASKTLCAWARLQHGPATHCVPSLSAGIQELIRLDA
ncbi:MAG: hypothetical protein WBE13_00490 [Candidatus Acidiferrum sp.]